LRNFANIQGIINPQETMQDLCQVV